MDIRAKSFLVDTFTHFSQLFRKFVKKTFVGTRAEWDALTLAEKKQYDICNITDDEPYDPKATSIETISGVYANILQCIRYGKLVIIAFDNLRASSAIGEYAPIASGLPKPYTGLSETGKQVACGRLSGSAYAYVSAEGHLSIGVGGWDGSRADGSIVYVTEGGES